MKNIFSDKTKNIFFISLFLVGIALLAFSIANFSQRIGTSTALTITAQVPTATISITQTPTTIIPTNTPTIKFEPYISLEQESFLTLSTEGAIFGHAYLKIPKNILSDQEQTIMLLIDTKPEDDLKPVGDDSSSIIDIFGENILLYPNLRATLNGTTIEMTKFWSDDRNIETSTMTKSSFLEWRWDIVLADIEENSLKLSIFALEENQDEKIQHPYKTIDISIQKEYVFELTPTPIAPTSEPTQNLSPTPLPVVQTTPDLGGTGGRFTEMFDIWLGGIVGITSMVISLLQYRDQKKSEKEEKLASKRTTNQIDFKEQYRKDQEKMARRKNEKDDQKSS